MFLSQRRGAMLVALLPDNASALGAESIRLDLAYATPEGESRTGTLGVRYDGQPLDDRGQYLPRPGLARTLALALLVTGMHDAARVYAADPAAAVALMEAALARFRADVASIGPSDLDAEIVFAEALLALLQAGAPQGNLHGEAAY